MTSSRASKASSLDSHLGFWLRYVSNQVSSRFQKMLEDQGTSVTEWVALRTLFDKRETTHAELIDSLGMTKGAASKVISRLEEKKLATRRRADGSSREQMLMLTPRGMALVPKLAALADGNDEHFFGHLGREERNALMKTLKNLVGHHQFKEIPVA
ncbi:MAG: MarR family winged helix-turn-helix transcriptional regulator [Bordetella sp.]|uniref:MarR family winged helix-turn-helix transcriptional regulator n=1 Tax=Bordetella sp. TaxID=28081 RepID=UPI003F7BBD34